jgi:hypothetical protein
MAVSDYRVLGDETPDDDSFTLPRIVPIDGCHAKCSHARQGRWLRLREPQPLQSTSARRARRGLQRLTRRESQRISDDRISIDIGHRARSAQRIPLYQIQWQRRGLSRRAYATDDTELNTGTGTEIWEGESRRPIRVVRGSSNPLRNPSPARWLNELGLPSKGVWTAEWQVDHLGHMRLATRRRRKLAVTASSVHFSGLAPRQSVASVPFRSRVRCEPMQRCPARNTATASRQHPASMRTWRPAIERGHALGVGVFP